MIIKVCAIILVSILGVLNNCTAHYQSYKEWPELKAVLAVFVMWTAVGVSFLIIL